MKRGAITKTGSAAVLALLVMTGAGPAVCAAGESEEPGSPGRVELGIAARYPNDVGIETAAAVQFTEDFEHATVDDLIAGWESNSNPERMSFSTDTPAGSGGTQSVFFDGSADLYTRLLPGHDQLYRCHSSHCLITKCKTYRFREAARGNKALMQSVAPIRGVTRSSERVCVEGVLALGVEEWAPRRRLNPGPVLGWARHTPIRPMTIMKRGTHGSERGTDPEWDTRRCAEDQTRASALALFLHLK